jgi:hypothetical protein
MTMPDTLSVAMSSFGSFLGLSLEVRPTGAAPTAATYDAAAAIGNFKAGPLARQATRPSTKREIVTSCINEKERTRKRIRASLPPIGLLEALPTDIIDAVVEKLPPANRGVVRHVSRALRRAVARVEERARVSNVMRAEELCESIPLMCWAIEQHCPWTIEKAMAAAAGKPQLTVLLISRVVRAVRDVDVSVINELLALHTKSIGTNITVLLMWPLKRDHESTPPVDAPIHI